MCRLSDAKVTTADASPVLTWRAGQRDPAPLPGACWYSCTERRRLFWKPSGLLGCSCRALGPGGLRDPPPTPPGTQQLRLSSSCGDCRTAGGDPVPPLTLTFASSTPRGAQGLPLIPLGVWGFAPPIPAKQPLRGQRGQIHTRAHDQAQPALCPHPRSPCHGPPSVPTSPQVPRADAPLPVCLCEKSFSCKLIPRGLALGKPPGAGGPDVLGDPGQLLGLGVFGQEVKLHSNSRSEPLFPRQAGRAGGREKSLPFCQQVSSVSGRQLPKPALLEERLCIKAAALRSQASSCTANRNVKPQTFLWTGARGTEGRAWAEVSIILAVGAPAPTSFFFFSFFYTSSGVFM